MENPTVGYALGMVEGFLESVLEQGFPGAQIVLEHLKIVENAYIEKSRLLAEAEKKLENISLNLNGWSQN
jgi:hypothetical protein